MVILLLEVVNPNCANEGILCFKVKGTRFSKKTGFCFYTVFALLSAPFKEVALNNKPSVFSGRVDRFNYNDPLNTFKIFWVQAPDGQRSGYAKGHEIKGKRISIGAQITLRGEWHIDPKYQRYGEQFFFSDYDIN